MPQSNSTYLRTVMLLALLLVNCWSVAANTIISDYQVVFHPYNDRTGELRIAIRQFLYEAEPYLLVVDPVSFVTYSIPAGTVDLGRKLNPEIWQNTPYYQALIKFSAPPYRLQNYGLLGASKDTGGYFLTVDLCPSLRNFEKEMFTKTMELPQVKHGPVPVAIALTGVWANNHQADLEWLKEQAIAHRLEITWINHSYSHPYDNQKSYNQTFLLTPGVDFRDEVLMMERLMLSKGIIPSPFCRFPGLISDQRVILALKDMGLIPVGSNAWLALGQDPKPGSVILVHGNGNEPKGIQLLLEFYQQQKEAFASQKSVLMPLRDAF